MNQKIENWVLLGIATVFGIYVLIRAWVLPITVDESSTAINHVPRLVFDSLTYEGEANPNNHILNTILIKIFTGIFGWHHVVVRLPVLIGSCFYAWASVHLVQRLSTASWVRVFSLLMLFGNPYMLEFFSLARGYGLAAGLMTFALWQSWQFLEQNDRKYLLRAIVFAGLAVYSNFTLLIFFAPFIAAIFFASWQQNKSWSKFWGASKPALIALSVFLVLWIAPLKRLSKHSEILNWNALGTYFDSVQRSVRAAIHANELLGNGSDLVFTWMVALGAVAVICLAFYRLLNLKFQLHKDPRVFLVLMLFGAIITNIAQVHLTKTPYLQSRLALFYWPLFALSLSAAAAWLNSRYGIKKSWLYMAPLSVLLLINLTRTVNLSSTFEWFHDSDTFTVLDYIKKNYEMEGRTEPYTFDTEWFMQNSFVFHIDKKFRGYDKYVKLAAYHGRRPPPLDTDYYYAINQDEKNQLAGAYEVALQVPRANLTLFRKKR